MPSVRVPYLDRDSFARMIRTYRNTGRGADKLAAALALIAGGVWDRFRLTRDRDDFVQEVVIHLMQKPLKKADLQKHCFNYMTTCAIRYGLKLRDQERGDARRFATYAAELVASGRPVVGEDRTDNDQRKDCESRRSVVGRESQCRTPDEELDAAEAERLARDLLAAIDGIREEIAATRGPRRKPTQRTRRPRRRAT